MQKKTKILIGILIIGIILDIGWYGWNLITCQDICEGSRLRDMEPIGLGYYACVTGRSKCSKICGAECEHDPNCPPGFESLCGSDCPEGFICDEYDCKCIKKTLSEIPTENEVIKENETADWKTYRNEEYGFEVKYPEDWEECNKDHLLVIIPPVEDTRSEIDKGYDCMYGSVRFKKPDEKYVNLNNLRSYYWSLYQNIGEPLCKPELLIKEITFNEQPAIQIESCDVTGMYTGSGIYLIHNQEVFHIEVSSYAQRLAGEELINQMFSTFRFLE